MPNLIEKVPVATSPPLAGTESLYMVTAGGADARVLVSDFGVGRIPSFGGLLVTDSTIPTNGLYLPAANTVGTATNGTLRLSVSTTAVTSTLPITIGAPPVAASANAADFVIGAASGNRGLSILTGDAALGTIIFGAASDSVLAFLEADYTSNKFHVGTQRVGASLLLKAGNAITGITLIGASGSEQANVTRTMLVGSASVVPDGTLHVHTASAGTVTANALADDLVVEGSSNTGISILASDSSLCSLVFGSPADNIGSYLEWTNSGSALYVGTSKVGATLNLRAGNDIPNLTLSGASGSELATFVKDVTAGGLITAGTLRINTAPSADVGLVSTHSYTMSFSGTNYKVMLVAA